MKPTKKAKELNKKTQDFVEDTFGWMDLTEKSKKKIREQILKQYSKHNL